MAYQTERDKVADQQWQAQFDEAKRQYDQQYALSTQKTYKTYDKDGDKVTVNNGSLTTSQIKSLQTALGVTADGKWGPESQAAAQKKLGASSADAAWANYQKNLNGRIEGNDGGGVTSFTGSTYSEAAAYLKANGKSASGLMTSSEWTRHKNKNNSAGGEHEASSYKEYLAAYIYGVMN
jgi:peptidoglycan hydrolase-like protein with peptidoglycan-binding domain